MLLLVDLLLLLFVSVHSLFPCCSAAAAIAAAAAAAVAAAAAAVIPADDGIDMFYSVCLQGSCLLKVIVVCLSLSREDKDIFSGLWRHAADALLLGFVSFVFSCFVSALFCYHLFLVSLLTIDKLFFIFILYLFIYLFIIYLI